MEKDLKTLFIEDVIPWAEKMLQKQIEHSKFMLEQSNKTHHVYLFGLIKLPVERRTKNMALHYWNESEKTVAHIKQRIQEYKDYAAAL